MNKLLLLFATLPAFAGDFVNLTFDEPDLTGPLDPLLPGGPYLGRTADLLPGWTVRVGGDVASQVTYAPINKSSFGPVTLRENPAGQLGFGSLELHSPVPPAPEIRLSQRGTIPADAAGLWIYGAGYAQMFINGQRVGDTVNDLTVDVSRFAGQEVDLEFLVRSGDSIRFDVLGFVPVPEPSTWALFGVGAAAILGLARRKH